MRVASLIMAAAVLAMAPMARAQTELPAPAPVSEAATEPAAAAVEAAEPAAAEDAAGANAVAPTDTDRVCRTIERSESRLRSRRERVCRTQAEWDALQQRNGRSGPQSSNN